MQSWGDVTRSHDEAPFAHAGFAPSLCAAVHGAVFAKNSTVSNVHGGMHGTVEMQVLRIPADYGVGPNNNVLPQPRVA